MPLFFYFSNFSLLYLQAFPGSPVSQNHHLSIKETVQSLTVKSMLTLHRLSGGSRIVSQSFWMIMYLNYQVEL